MGFLHAHEVRHVAYRDIVVVLLLRVTLRRRRKRVVKRMFDKFNPIPLLLNQFLVGKVPNS